MSSTITWIVEFWPRRKVEVQMPEDAGPDDVLAQAIRDNGWAGGEHTSNGLEFKAWVYKKGSERDW